MNLTSIIQSQIHQDGPMSFATFMQLALYHPQHGYYTSGDKRVGRDGDFFTNVSVGSTFGRILATQFLEMWQRLESPSRFTIVEQGANDGQLTVDILTASQALAPAFHQALDYWIIEPSPTLQQRQKEHIPQHLHNSINWVTSLADITKHSITGVHVSNELLDAMPVHLIEWDGTNWLERMVTLGDSDDTPFLFSPTPISDPNLMRHVTTLPTTLAVGYQTEVNLNAVQWTHEVTRIFDRGYLLIVDYGFPHSQFYAPERSEGTLSCYSQHQRSADPLSHPGAIDITAHVDFTSIAETAITNGFQLIGFADQHHFMVGASRETLLQIEKSPLDPEHTEFIARFKTLMHPGTMGQAFKFLCFEKSPSPSPAPLAGFAFSRDPHHALELTTSA